MMYILTFFNVEWLTLDVMYAPYPNRDLYNILPLLKDFLKPIYTLYALYNILANVSVYIYHIYAIKLFPLRIKCSI